MRNLFFATLILFAVSCNEENNNGNMNADSMSKKDSFKKALSEDLPPADEIHQFNWFYSAFASALISWNDSAINACINKVKGLWVIDAPGAMPHFTRAINDSTFKALMDKSKVKFTSDNMIAEPKQEEMPKADCNKPGGYDKEGCFTTETNVFREEKIWVYAGLAPNDEDAVKNLAETITRTVVNTKVGKFYFSLIKGSWYLTFIDVRKPCAA